ncbi:Flp pilus assembly protein CpaB [Dermatobacter hominis]|uniref:Flp pilus assembly protein CpaB n=1 Tax=Dermatobacter hominis TaxID=2884263 RepID=UPI001D10B90F|nr:Flp pilus assembly protein CpaB [Dermatobacter hominis]UDY36068.1 Flp pilus assembly protein CpaB [Dermatobacter hominis]
MSSRRTLILIGAVVIGALAAFLTLSYVRGVENRSDEAAQMVEVVVAAGPIAKGSSSDAAIEGQQLVMEKRRQDELPASPVRRFADIQGQVAAVDLGGGEVITASMFVPATALNGSKSANLDKGNVAITITVDEAAGVAGLVQPGDNINILANYCSVTTGGASGGTEGGDACALQRNGAAGSGAVTLGEPSSYLFQGVKVLAVGQSLGQPVAAAPAAEGADPATATTAPPAASPLITVQLPPDQAQLLASLRSASLYLTLNRPDYTPVPIPFTNSLPALPGELGTSPYPAQAASGQ